MAYWYTGCAFFQIPQSYSHKINVVLQNLVLHGCEPITYSIKLTYKGTVIWNRLSKSLYGAKTLKEFKTFYCRIL